MAIDCQTVSWRKAQFDTAIDEWADRTEIGLNNSIQQDGREMMWTPPTNVKHDLSIVFMLLWVLSNIEI